MDYGSLGTEMVNARSERLDEMSALEIAKLMNELDAGALSAVRCALPAIARAAEEAAARIPVGGRMIYMGAGTSGRLGVLDASECPPTFNATPDMVIGLIAGGDSALRHSVEGAEDDRAAGANELDALGINALDMVVAISASGAAPYCIGALERAREAGALCVSMCCNAGAKLSECADIAIEMPTGAEVLSGSTRLRAGTATKLALNTLSTAAMVRMGKAYKNLMVDVRASNAKLRDRAERICMRAMNIDREEATKRLAAAGGNIKLAIITKETGVDAREAQLALNEAKGFVSAAIRALKTRKECG